MRNALGNSGRLTALILLFMMVLTVNGTSQTKSFELSGHFTTLNVDEYAPGFGATFAYYLNRRISVESTLNFYPGNPRTNLGRGFSGLGDLNTGTILQGQFGVRTTILRLKKLNLFVKAKPGFVSFSDLRYQFQSSIGGTGTTVVGWDAGRQTGFALDFGGGVELSTSRSTFIRFDAGDTYFQYPSIHTTFNLGPDVGIRPVIMIPGNSVHTFQFSVGMGYKFGRTK